MQTFCPLVISCHFSVDLFNLGDGTTTATPSENTESTEEMIGTYSRKTKPFQNFAVSNFVFEIFSSLALINKLDKRDVL